MGFDEDLARARSLNTSGTKAAAEVSFRDPLEAYNRLIAEFDIEVRRAVDTLLAQSVPSIPVLLRTNGLSEPLFVRTEWRGWLVANDLVVFDDADWGLGLRVIGRAVKRPERTKKFGDADGFEWDVMGKAGLPAGQKAIQLFEGIDAERPQPQDGPYSVPDRGEQLWLNVNRATPDLGTLWVPLREVLVHGVADILTGGTAGMDRLRSIGVR